MAQRLLSLIRQNRKFTVNRTISLPDIRISSVNQGELIVISITLVIIKPFWFIHFFVQNFTYLWSVWTMKVFFEDNIINRN